MQIVRGCKGFSTSILLFWVGVFALISGVAEGLQGNPGAFGSCGHQFDTYRFLSEIDNHILALREKKIFQAYHDYTCWEFRKQTSFEDFQKIVNEYPSLRDNVAITMQSIQFFDDQGIYCGLLTAKTGEQLLIEFNLLKEDKRWKILGFKLHRTS